MCIVLSTKSMTLTLTDIGSQKSLKNGTERRKARRISNNVRSYLFVDKRVTIVYIVLSYPTKSTTLTSTNVGSLQNFQNGTKRLKARRILMM